MYKLLFGSPSVEFAHTEGQESDVDVVEVFPSTVSWPENLECGNRWNLELNLDGISTSW